MNREWSPTSHACAVGMITIVANYKATCVYPKVGSWLVQSVVCDISFSVQAAVINAYWQTVSKRRDEDKNVTIIYSLTWRLAGLLKIEDPALKLDL
jgi:hypothetical protein